MKFRDYIHEGTLVPSSKPLVKEELKRADGEQKEGQRLLDVRGRMGGEMRFRRYLKEWNFTSDYSGAEFSSAHREGGKAWAFSMRTGLIWWENFGKEFHVGNKIYGKGEKGNFKVNHAEAFQIARNVGADIPPFSAVTARNGWIWGRVWKKKVLIYDDVRSWIRMGGKDARTYERLVDKLEDQVYRYM